MRYRAETNCAKFMSSDHVGRNENEPSQASLVEFAVINLPELVKSDIDREATARSTDLAARSIMGWHT